MRRFHLINPDPRDNAACELVGQGVQFNDGTAVVLWSGVSVEISHQDPETIATGENLEAVWIDPPPPQTVTRPLRILGRDGTR